MLEEDGRQHEARDHGGCETSSSRLDARLRSTLLTPSFDGSRARTKAADTERAAGSLEKGGVMAMKDETNQHASSANERRLAAAPLRLGSSAWV